MKCKNCGAKLSLEDKYCPYCGTVNEQASKHNREMEQYKTKFTRAEKTVYSQTKKSSGITSRMITIAVLAVLIGIVGHLENNIYSIRRTILEKRAVSRYEEYNEKIQNYLNDDDYVGFSSFMEDNYLTYVDEYNEYYMLASSAMRYKLFFYYLYYLMEGEKNNADCSMWLAQLSEEIGEFYKKISQDRYEYYGEDVCSAEKMEIAGQMEEDILGIMRTYFGFSKEDADSLKGLSDGKRAALIEDYYVKKTEGAE